MGSLVAARMPKIHSSFGKNATIVLHEGDCLDGLRRVPDGSIKLIISSPPYNIGKEYEKTVELEHYVDNMRPVLEELVRVLSPEGSLCWEVGNYIEKGEVYPLDIFFYPIFKSLNLFLRNRIVWHFNHGLHCSKRFSGRYEVIIWFTKTDNYTFNLDNVRVPSKYPGKRHFKVPKKAVNVPSFATNSSGPWYSVLEGYRRVGAIYGPRN